MTVTMMMLFTVRDMMRTMKKENVNEADDDDRR